MNQQAQKVAEVLLANAGQIDPDFWYWLKPAQPVSAKNANKFLLGAILDYQIPTKVAWENARRLAEDILGDPDELWHEITKATLEDWQARRQQYSLHRFPKGHERVWTIGSRIVELYNGDARQIWLNQSISVTLDRLNNLRIGEQLSRMIAGALMDTGHVTGTGDVKVDIHVCRVLGRAVQGSGFNPTEIARVLALTRQMHPDNPWLLDRPLYILGKQLCKASNPVCDKCFLHSICLYNNPSAASSDEAAGS